MGQILVNHIVINLQNDWVRARPVYRVDNPNNIAVAKGLVSFNKNNLLETLLKCQIWIVRALRVESVLFPACLKNLKQPLTQGLSVVDRADVILIKFQFQIRSNRNSQRQGVRL